MPLDDKLISELDPTVDQMGAEVPVERGGQNYKIDLARIVASVGPRSFPTSATQAIYISIVKVTPSQGTNDVSLKFKILLRQNGTSSPTILEFVFGTNATATGGGSLKLVSGYCPAQLFDNLKVERLALSGGKFEFILSLTLGIYASPNMQIEIFDAISAPSNLAEWQTSAFQVGSPAAEETVFLTQTASGSGLPVNGSSGFDVLTTDPSFAEGKLFYSEAERTLVLFNDIVGSSLSIGREHWTRVLNDTGATIPNGAPVYVVSASGQVPTVALARANTLQSARMIGLATNEILDGQAGEITLVGKVRDLDTSGFSEGAAVYLSATTAGGLTSIAPVSPYYQVQIGVVTKVGTTDGEILVRAFSPFQTNPVSAANLGVECFPISLIGGQYGNFYGQFQSYSAFVSRFDTTIASLTSLVTQSATGGWVRMGVADASRALLGQTSQFEPSAVGLANYATEAAIPIVKNQIYYFVIGGTTNGCLFGGATGYSANDPYIGFENGNANLSSGDLETTPSGGSQSGNRTWMIGLGV